MANLSTFTKFAQLPGELQLRIWEEATAGPSMHVFDVCFPSWQGNDRSRAAFTSHEDTPLYTKYKNSAFLDILDEPTEREKTGSVMIHQLDPSMYRLRDALALTSVDAAASSALKGEDTNTVILPGRKRIVRYDNSADVLFLRFSNGANNLSEDVLGGAEEIPFGLGTFSPVLVVPWSPEMTATVRSARRIALDVTETWTPKGNRAMLFEEIASLACHLEEGLEVLYLVDHCAGRCTRCKREGLKASELQTWGSLARNLHEDDEDNGSRSGDVIRGVGKTYREVFDFERLGWEDFHPTYIFARIMTAAILTQQKDTGRETFKGVRVLLAEDDPINGKESSVGFDCCPEQHPEKGESVRDDSDS